jgi:hypothetical protein
VDTNENENEKGKLTLEIKTWVNIYFNFF